MVGFLSIYIIYTGLGTVYIADVTVPQLSHGDFNEFGDFAVCRVPSTLGISDHCRITVAPSELEIMIGSLEVDLCLLKSHDGWFPFDIFNIHGFRHHVNSLCASSATGSEAAFDDDRFPAVTEFLLSLTGCVDLVIGLKSHQSFTFLEVVDESDFVVFHSWFSFDIINIPGGDANVYSLCASSKIGTIV